MGGESRADFDNIHPTFANKKIGSGIRILPLMLLHGMEPPVAFNRHAQIAFSLSRKRVFLDLTIHPHTPFSLHMPELVEVIPTDHSTVTCAIPCVPSIVQYIRFEGGYKPLAFDACRRYVHLHTKATKD